jgi:glycosyltransferase involved in cell wall biosynthesis
MSTVAIVMAAYNGEKYISEQIDSILASSYQDFELLIYDDGSKDNTMSILQSYESRYPQKIKVFHNDINLGVTRNFLHAFSRTTTDYIMFCDQDDVWKREKVAVTLKRMQHMEAQLGKGCPIAVFTDAVVVDQELNTINASFFCSGHLNPWRTDLARILMENKLIGCTIMVNAALRRILQSCPLPTQARYHDWWLALIASAFGKVCFIKEGTLLYRQHDGNVVGERGFLAYMKNRMTSLEKQKQALSALYEQAEEFLMLYGELLSEQKKEILLHFITLKEKNFIERRCELLRYGYLKTGIIRNIGLFMII